MKKKHVRLCQSLLHSTPSKSSSTCDIRTAGQFRYGLTMACPPRSKSASTTWLHTRVLNSDTAWVKRFILESKNNEIDIDARDSNRNTILHHASLLGHADLVKFLISHRADVHATTVESFTPLHKAAFGGHLECVKYLVEANSNVLAETRVRTG